MIQATTDDKLIRIYCAVEPQYSGHKNLHVAVLLFLLYRVAMLKRVL